MMANFQEEAMRKLGTSAPELASLVVSFRDLSEEIPEGSDTSVGVFILRSGAGVFFIPVVAKSNVIYPLDSLYDDIEKRFKPLTQSYIQQVLAQQTTAMGAAVQVPKYVNQNPSIYNMIVPPRTGKYAYASAGLFSEFVAALPAHLKEQFNVGLGDPGRVRNLSKLLNMAEVMEALAHSNPVVPSVNASTPEVQIYTAADAGKAKLADAAIQDILNVGYHIMGDNVTPRVAIESPRGAEGFGQLRGCEEGRAYEVVLRDGSTVKAMVPKQLRKDASSPDNNGDRDHVSVGLAVKNRPVPLAGGVIAITEYGDWITQQETVVRPNPIDISEVASELYGLAKIGQIGDLENGDTFAVITPKGMVGPYRADNVTHMSSMSIVQASEVGGDYRRITITASSAFKGDIFVDTSNMYLPLVATVIELDKNINQDVEISITAACNREELKNLSLLESQMVIRGHDNGFFSINGRSVGNEADLVRALLVGEGIAKEAALGFVKSAKERKSVTVYLSKKASDMDAIQPGDIPEYGQAPVPGSTELFDGSNVDQAAQTMDPGVVEATIMTQFLQDPSMVETISSYLPVIQEAIDKLGRAILLLRINSEADLPDDIASLITALRNTYRQLGDNSLKLEYMLNGTA